jgi:hypothetical protein
MVWDYVSNWFSVLGLNFELVDCMPLFVPFFVQTLFLYVFFSVLEEINKTVLHLCMAMPNAAVCA